MPHIYQGSKIQLIVVVSESRFNYVKLFRNGKYKTVGKYETKKSKTITVLEYTFDLLVSDVKRFLEEYPLAIEMTKYEKKKRRYKPRIQLAVIEYDRTTKKVKTQAKNWTLADEYNVVDLEITLRKFLRKRFGQEI